MSSFDGIFDTLSGREGSYSNNPDDAGGEMINAHKAAKNNAAVYMPALYILITYVTVMGTALWGWYQLLKEACQ